MDANLPLTPNRFDATGRAETVPFQHPDRAHPVRAHG